MMISIKNLSSIAAFMSDMPNHSNPVFLTCSSCHESFSLSAKELAHFCPLCGKHLHKEIIESIISSSSTFSLFANRYELIESIGKGGMGEVFLAFDTICGRKIALKKIRSDLSEHPQIRHRFLKEAHITCQLTHPAIIPIYSIHSSASAYYTMPYVEGETLKQIIRKTRQQEKNGEKLDHIGGSIPALMRIFITICQAISYAHSKGVLHRDLKPENIIIGKYGEVLILDWGLAKYMNIPLSEEEEEDIFPQPIIPIPTNAEITRLGKVVGTVAYMAPERALGQPATVQTDIYALGVILYQLLTLRNPFKRGSLKEFKKKVADKKLHEPWIDPVLAAPYRDVPRMLARVCKKCLNLNPKLRYQSMDELTYELENYLEGRSEWFQVAELDIKQKNDWEFQENVLIAEHVAITRVTEEAEWVNLMISQQSFTGNTRIETSVYIGEKGHGIGILVSIPEMSERTYINDGYCLWISSELTRSTKLLRSNVEVMQAPDIFLKRKKWTRLRIEKIDKTIHLYLDDILQFSYSALIPLIGTHIGMLSRDADFEINPLIISVGSLNLTVNCLAVPDAFLAHRDFAQALSEYRRIAYSFPDRSEGREAIFRSGLTYIEQSKGSENKNDYLELALKEFEKLHGTPGGPLEYLGKALVYQAQNEEEEEIKCFELAYRRYPHHPLLSLLQEQILSRMHEVSRQQRLTTYQFILLAVRHLPFEAIDKHTQRLFSSLQKHWEKLPFIEDSIPQPSTSSLKFAIPLAFWLAKPYVLGEIIEELLKYEKPSAVDLGNALVCLIELGSIEYASKKLSLIKEKADSIPDMPWNDLEDILNCHQLSLKEMEGILINRSYNELTFSQMRSLLYFLDLALDCKETSLVHRIIAILHSSKMTFDERLRFNLRDLWAFLLEKNWKQAGEIIEAYPIELLSHESTPLHFLYTCWLHATEGKDIELIHLMGLLHVTYPRSWTLANHEIIGNLLQRGWLDKAFLWEKRQLYRQLSLYYHCCGEELQSQFYHSLFQEQFLHVETD